MTTTKLDKHLEAPTLKGCLLISVVMIIDDGLAERLKGEP